MEFIFFILSMAGIFLLIIVSVYIVSVYSLLRINFKKGGCELADSDNMPEVLRGVFKDDEDALIKMGFEFSHSQAVDSPYAADNSKRWQNVYVNRQQKVFAELNLADMPQAPFLCDISFVSVFNDGSFLETVNYKKDAIFGSIPNTILVDRYAGSTEEQFSVHLKELSGPLAQKTAVIPDSREYAGFCHGKLFQYAPGLCRQGLLKENFDGTYSMPVKGALEAAYRGMNLAAKIQERRNRSIDAFRKAKMPLPSIPASLEAQRYVWDRALLSDKKPSPLAKPVLFFTTLLFFVIFLKMSLSFGLVFLVVAVILIHELGHLAGMKLFKYRNTNIFFIPFFGAATTGLKDDAPAYQKVIVYLLGPAPGLIVGTILILAGLYYNASLARAGGIFLFINYLNLLPIIPFDGGQVCSIILFSRFPFLEGAFQAVSAFLLAALGMTFHSVIFFILAWFMACSVPLKIASAKALSAFKRRMKESNLGFAPEEEIIAGAFESLQSKPFNVMPFAQRKNIVYSMLASAKEPPLSGGSRLGLFFIYLGLFIVPVFISLGYGVFCGIFFKDKFPKASMDAARTTWQTGARPFGATSSPGYPLPQAAGIPANWINQYRASKSDTLSKEEKELAGSIGFNTDVILLARKLGDDVKQFQASYPGADKKNIAAFSFAVEPQHSREAVSSLQSSLNGTGLQVFLYQRSFGAQGLPDRIAVAKLSSQFDILKLQQTDGVNYGISNEQVIDKLKEWDGRFGLRITGAGLDWVEAKFINQPEDMDSFAQEVCKFCPDAVEQGTGSVKNLAGEMKRENTLYLWWD